MKLTIDTEWFDCLLDTPVETLGEVMAAIIWNRPAETDTAKMACRIIDGFLNNQFAVKARRSSRLVNKEQKQVEAEEANTDVEYIYGLYPVKCPASGRSLGKSSKDKNRIKRLFKTIPVDKVASVINDYVTDCTENGRYMKNFSTFLNNFPDDGVIPQQETTAEERSTWQ